MPVDVSLSTNTPTATIELRQAQPLGTEGHLAAFLVVRSGAFAAALPFVFHRDDLTAFAEALDAVAATRSGVALLRGSASDDVIRFEAGNEGALRVCGDLYETSGMQRLTFSFAAEWEGVDAFSDGIRRLRARDVS